MSGTRDIEVLASNQRAGGNKASMEKEWTNSFYPDRLVAAVTRRCDVEELQHP
jgi:hypothetical protein